MTLLLDEIRVFGALTKSIIFQAADRRVTINGKFHSNRKKIFKIPYLNAGVGYYGLAQLDNTKFFSDWLLNFINHAQSMTTIKDFSHRLCDLLNREVDKEFLINYPSGFHVCGFNSDRYPEFWHVRNIEKMEGNIYTKWGSRYNINEDFLSGITQNLNNDKNLASFSGNLIQYYINGDVRSFHSLWRQLDPFISEMLTEKDFYQPQNREDIERIIKWKLSVISSFYKNFAKKVIIGSPIDVFSLIPQ